MRAYKSVVNLNITEVAIIWKFHFNRLCSAYTDHKNAGKKQKLELAPVFYKVCAKYFVSIMFN